jgi:exosortase
MSQHIHSRTEAILQAPAVATPARSAAGTVALAGFLLACLVWCYWSSLCATAQRWDSDPQYSHGFLVPAFALFLIWQRRSEFQDMSFQGTWWGVPVVVGSVVLRLAGASIFVEWLEGISLLPALAGICLCLGGSRLLRWVWPGICFLIFMLPIPYRLEIILSYPLQRLATKTSTYMLQTLGLPAVAEGNVILLSDVRIGVIGACNGLGMLVTFIALTTAVVLLLRTSWWEKVCVALSAIPISLVANIARITATGVLAETVGGEAADLVFHDLAGWLMMPFALGLIWLELHILSRLFVDVAPTRQISLHLDLELPAPAEPRTPVAALGNS